VKGNPSLSLKDKVLEGGWKVGDLIAVGRAAGGTGGNFSVAYHVTGKNGEKAFLKALDYSRAMQQREVAKALQAMTAAYLFECDVLNKCRESGLDRIIRAITSGTITIDEEEHEGVVEYLIFELAEGDLRKYLQINEKFDLAWSLRSLHQITTGLKQLHTSGIYHQDLKPSNVLTFNGNDFKLSDLGRSVYDGHMAAHYQLPFAGDPSYAPPDLAYGAVPTDFQQWRLSCDAYHLGSMVVFFITGVGMTALLMKNLDISFHPRIPPFSGHWTGSYQEVLPYVLEAFDNAVVELASGIQDPRLRNTLTRVVRELCNPNAALRGHPRERRANGNSFSLERYITEFNLLAHRAEVGIFGVN
jgi:eukaryotic-like serine/threonine-protein kinase